MLFTEGFVSIGEIASGYRVLLNQVLIIERHDNHDDRRDTHGNRRTFRAGLSEKRIAGHHKSTPADNTTQGQGPDI